MIGVIKMRKVILDLDTGIDDAMALGVVLGSPDFELLGVIGSYGNVYTEDGVQNVLNILHAAGRDDVPVYLGAKHAMQATDYTRMDVVTTIHGANGVGEAYLPKAPGVGHSRAVAFLLAQVQRYGQDLTIIATGPMTNLGLALKQNADVMKQVGQIVIMGGALTVTGNVNEYAEANIIKDPEAAKLLFDSGIDITMVGLDVTTRSILTKADTHQWNPSGSEMGNFYETAVNYYIDVHEQSLAPEAKGCFLHDPSAVIAAIHPEWFTTINLFLDVIQSGPARGRTVGDAHKIRIANPNTKVCIGVQTPRVINYLNQALINLCK